MAKSKSHQCFLLFIAVAKAADPSTYFGGLDNSVYLDWLNSSSYDRSTWLESSSATGVAVHWSTNESHVQLAVACKATGWVGFGLAEAGGMRGADIVLYSAETDELVDSYVLDELVNPMPDDCQSWTLVRSQTEDGFIIFEANRLLDTGDSQDHIIIDDSDQRVEATRVIAAWGNESSPSYHGLSNRAKGAVRFMSKTAVDELELFQENMAAEAEGTFLLAAVDFAIPATETTYHKFCFSTSDLVALGAPIDQDLHVIGIEPIIDARTAKYVHHFVLRALSVSLNTTDECNAAVFIETAYAWAPGNLPMMLPYNVGSPLGSSGFKAFQLETHYNNPQLDDGMIDSSGVKFYYTSKKRQYDMGIFQTGDPLIGLLNEPVSINGGLSEHTFDCKSSCSSSIVDQPLTVIVESLHMHKSGVRMVNSQIRNDEVIRQAEAQFWDFDQQGSLAVIQQPFTIAPGDSFRTSCIYNAPNGEDFGLGSNQEMCIAFLSYYPRVSFAILGMEIPYLCGLRVGDFFPPCGVEWSNSNISDISQVGRSFGVAPSTCPAISGPIATATPAASDSTAAPAASDSTAAPTAAPKPLPSASSTVTHARLLAAVLAMSFAFAMNLAM
ncbi:copper type II ascorbate-dependent monooxygenase [Fragilaria crotonensis]|nr:copper type II ascorbate-dependent monooxygenase [Fragilaria crotonensis]